MRFLSKILVPILISTLLIINVGINVIYHTCNKSGDINISLFIEKVCQYDDCLNTNIIDNIEKNENHCCDKELLTKDFVSDEHSNKNKNFNSLKKDYNFKSILDECCSSKTDFIQTKLDFTFNYIDYNFKTNLVIGETIKLKINDLNNDYKVILDNIDSEIKKIPTKSLSYLIKYIYTTNSSKDENIF